MTTATARRRSRVDRLQSFGRVRHACLRVHRESFDLRYSWPVFEIGNNLKEARLRRRVDLMDAEGATKIRSKYLAALETEDFDILPGPVYARGFLRTYARFLGLNPQLYIDEYNARFGRFEDDDVPVLGRAPDSPLTSRPQLSMRSMIVASLLALACVAWFGLHDPRSGSHRSVTASIASPSTDTAVASLGQSSAPVVPSAAAGSTSVHRATSPVVIVSTAGGASWIEVRRSSATGTVIFQGMLTAGARRRFSAPGGVRRLFVTAGAPSVVRLKVAGAHGTAARLRGVGSQRASYVVTSAAVRIATA